MRNIEFTFKIDVDRTHPGANPFERADEIRVLLREKVEGELVVTNWLRKDGVAEASVALACKTDDLRVNVELTEDDGEEPDATLIYSRHPVNLVFD